MNNYKYFSLFMIFSLVGITQSILSNTTFAGSIKLCTTKPLTEPVIFKMHCNGTQCHKVDGKTNTQISNDQQLLYFEFNLPLKTQELHILVTERPSLPQKDEIPVVALKTNKTYPYRIFKLTMHDYYNKEKKAPEYAWVINELSNKNPEIVIPENTIIVYMTTDVFDRIENIPPMAHNQMKSFIRLPTIITKVVKPDILVKAGYESIFNNCDFNIIHKKPDERMVLCDNRLLSMDNSATNTQQMHRPWL